MEVNQYRFRLAQCLLNELIRLAEWTINWRQKRTPLQINNSDLLSISLNKGHALTGRSIREICRTYDARFFINPLQYIFIIPRMVAHRNAMDSPFEKFLSNRSRNSSACCSVLPIHNNNVRIILAL